MLKHLFHGSSPHDTTEFKAEIRKKLSETLIKQKSPPKRHVLTIQANQPLTTAFEFLLQHNILSAPVLKQENPFKYAGFLDTAALVSAIVSVHDHNPQKAHHDLELGDFVAGLSAVDDSFHNDQLDVWTPSYLARINPITELHDTDNLLRLCELMGMGIRRVVVTNSKGEITRVLSQSWVVGVIEEIVNKISFQVTLDEIGWSGRRQVICCGESEPVINALKLMDKYKFTGVPIANKDGFLIGHITAKNLRDILRTRSTSQLDSPLSSFVTPLSVEHGQELSVKATISLTELFHKFSTARSHRLYVVDDANQLIGICSFQDLISSLIRA
eukprot:c7608_g1_i1.p1 GENE.c7608_g1_i1~~c7608_g1_i1.p1  ORF type:complete len:342 (-),score=63.21 c7608_g1_i1:276-1262(-)